MTTNECPECGRPIHSREDHEMWCPTWDEDTQTK